MKALVIYESMYGNTHLIADSIAEGLRSTDSGVEVGVAAVDGATSALVAAADLVVAGGPTHAHGMSRESTRHGAVEAAGDPAKQLTLDPDAEGEGLRDWFDQVDGQPFAQPHSTHGLMVPPHSLAEHRRASPSDSVAAASS